MRTQCRRIYSAMPSHCDRICKGRCEEACVSDASPESRVHSSEPSQGEGLFEQFDSTSFYSPSPYLPSVQREVWQILVGGLHALSDNDHGRPWPYPVRRRLAKLIAEHHADLCRKAAREAREIVVSQDRAPNITGLFEKRLRDLAAEAEKRAETRRLIRASLEEVGVDPLEIQFAGVGGEG